MSLNLFELLCRRLGFLHHLIFHRPGSGHVHGHEEICAKNFPFLQFWTATVVSSLPVSVMKREQCNTYIRAIEVDCRRLAPVKGFAALYELHSVVIPHREV